MKRRKIYTLISVCLVVVVAFFCLNKPTIVHDLQSTLTKKELTTSSINATFTGDLLFEGPLYEWMDNYQYGDYFDLVKPYLTGDLVVGNQEVLVAGEELGLSGWGYSFNAPYSIGEQLPSLGFNVLTLANNHMNDRGIEGMVNTRKLFDEMNMFTTGMYLSQEERDNVNVIEKNNVKFAFLAYTYSTNTYVDPNDTYAIPYFLDANLNFTEEYQEQLKKDVEKAKENSDVVIVAMHWGQEFTYQLTPSQIEVANYLNELGVDIIIGNHSHCLQPIEYLTSSTGHETFVVYSLGNFVSADVIVDRSSEMFKNMYQVGGILNIDILYDHQKDKTKVENVKLTPFVNHYDQQYQNFKMIPLGQYNEEKAKTHDRRAVSELFTYENILNEIHSLYDETVNVNLEAK